MSRWCGPATTAVTALSPRVLRDRGPTPSSTSRRARVVRGDARTHLQIFERAGGIVGCWPPDQLAALDARSSTRRW
jgi:hypothetical protein